MLKLKAALAVLVVASSFAVSAQTELAIQDLNYIPKQNTFLYNGSVTSTKLTAERETVDGGTIVEVTSEAKELSTEHLLAYGISDRFFVFAGINHIISEKTKNTDVEVNGTEIHMPNKIDSNGLNNVLAGLNFRFLEQNTDSINADFKFSYSTGLNESEVGSTRSDGNSAQVAPDYTISLEAGKKFERFELRGALQLIFTESGKYTSLDGNTNGSDLKIDRDGYTAIGSVVAGQFKVNEQLFIYGSLSQAIMTEVRESYRDAAGASNKSEQRAKAIIGLSLGGKILLAKNLYAFAEIKGTGTSEQKIVTKTNGIIDNDRDKIKNYSQSDFILGAALAF